MILQSLSQKLAWFNSGNGTRRITSIHGYTEIRLFRASHEKKRNIIRAHPDYRGKGYWLDWRPLVCGVEPSDLLLSKRIQMEALFKDASGNGTDNKE